MGIELPEMEIMDFTSIPDVQSREMVNKSVKQFFEVFNEKHIGDILKFVYNTGRYGSGNKVRADVGPVLISKQDEYMKRLLKDTNTALETQIDSLVKNGLSRDIALPVELNTLGPSADDGSPSAATSPEPPVYKNYFFGKDAAQIERANECSIVRGSALKVEANR